MERTIEKNQECQSKKNEDKKRNTCQTPSFIAMHVISSTHSRYKSNHERTNMHIKNVLILEYVFRIHRSEVADILNSCSKHIHSSTNSIGITSTLRVT